MTAPTTLAGELTRALFIEAEPLNLSVSVHRLKGKVHRKQDT